MDLPSCPSCGQSVLDENPEVCPFCGAAMSASGGKKPAPDKGKKPAPKAKQKEITSKDEDPFAIESISQKPEVRVALRKIEGRTHLVKCPMCETSGYVPEWAAGKPVKCANPSCMVPVFEAPPVEKKEEAPVQESSGTSLFMIIFGVIMLAASGAAVWFFVLRGDDTTNEDPNQIANSNVPNDTDPIEYNPVFEDDQQNQDQDDKPFDAVSYRQNLLDNTMQSISRQRTWNSQTNRPADCRQLLSETYARVGQIEQAIEQLSHIDKQNTQTFFNKRLAPRVEIAWRQTDASAKQTSLAEAEKAAAETPKAGGMRFDDLSSFAALLVAEGRPDDAQKWIEFAVDEANITDPKRFDRLRQVSSQVRVLRELPNYPISPLIDHPAHRWRQPEWVTVTMLLVAHGKDAKALEWARRATDPRVRADALLAYSRWKAQGGKTTPEQVIALVSDEPPASQVRILADAATFFAKAENQDASEKVLAAADTQLESLGGGEEFKIPAPAELLNLKLPDPSPIQNRVLALAALARAHAAIDDNEQAWKIVQQAIKLCRSIGPSPLAISSRPLNQNASGAEQIRQELREKLEIDNDNTLRIRFNSYVSKLKELQPLAELRMQTLEALLSESLLWGQAANVWEEMQSRIDETDGDLKEPFLKTSLLTEVKAALEKASATEQLKDLQRRIPSSLPERDAQSQFLAELDQMITDKEFGEMPEAVNSTGIDRERLGMSLLDRVLPIADAGDFETTVQILESLPPRISATRADLSLMREQIYYYLARIAGKHGRSREFHELVKKQLPSAVEEISALAGICVGIENAPKPGNGAEPTAAE